MTLVIPVQCQTCKHFHAQKRGNYCDAFPDAPIPREILELQFDHRQPHPSDHGIQWEPITPGTRHPFEEDER